MYFFITLAKLTIFLLNLPELKINNSTIKREYDIWRKHINIIENKLSKDLGLSYKATFLLSQKFLKCIYFSFVHNSYINYANIAWASTNQTKIKKILNKQMHASRIIYYEKKQTHARSPAHAIAKRFKHIPISHFQTL